MPPPLRNHRTPMLGNTPASIAAFSLDAPRAIASQNRTRCSLRPAGGCPPQRVPAAAARSKARFLLGIATPQVERCDNQLNPPGGAVDVRVCAWEQVVAGDRAGVLGGRCVQGDRG